MWTPPPFWRQHMKTQGLEKQANYVFRELKWQSVPTSDPTGDKSLTSARCEFTSQSLLLSSESKQHQGKDYLDQEHERGAGIAEDSSPFPLRSAFVRPVVGSHGLSKQKSVACCCWGTRACHWHQAISCRTHVFTFLAPPPKQMTWLLTQILFRSLFTDLLPLPQASSDPDTAYSFPTAQERCPVT